MRNHDTLAYHQMLKLGLSLGVLHVLCAPALAESASANSVATESNIAKYTERESEHKTSQLARSRLKTAGLQAEPIPKDGNGIINRNNPAQGIPTKKHTQIFRVPTFSGSHIQTTAQTNTVNANTTSAAEAFARPLTNITQEQAPENEPVLTTTATRASAVSEVNPLDLNLQEAEFSMEESWFDLLSSAWIDNTISEAAHIEPIAHTAPVIPAPDLSHVPAFTHTNESISNERVQNDFTQNESKQNEPSIAAENITETDKITADIVDEITADEITAENITETDEITADEITADEITADEITIERLQAGIQSQAPNDLSIAQARPDVTESEAAPEATSEATSETTEPEVIVILEERAPSSTEGLNRDLLSEILANHGVEPETYPVLDDELGTLRMVQLRSRDNEELGILRILQTAQAQEAAPALPPAPIAYLGGRLGFVDVDNVFRTENRFSEQVYQAGLSFSLVPKFSESTSLYAIAETNVARYNDFSQINYNEVQVQVGLRQRLLPRTFAQIGWRNQRLYSPGYREKLFGVQYLDALVSHRRVLSPKAWVDGFYQMRLGFADPETASRFRQTFTLSFNYGISRNLRTSVLYQLDFDDYTQIERYDTYQQLLGIISYNITPESRLSVFGGTRFGRSSDADINLDDTFYGAGLNVNVPLF